MTINGQSWVEGQPLPFDRQGEHEPVAQYGQRICLYLVATDGCTAPFEDAELELALACANGFYHGQWIGKGKGRKYQPVCVEVVNAIGQLQRIVCAVLAARKGERQDTEMRLKELVGKAEQLDGGHTVKVEDRPIVRPPSGQYAEVEF